MRGLERERERDGGRGRGRRKRTREMGAEREERIGKQSLRGAAPTPCSFQGFLSGETCQVPLPHTQKTDEATDRTPRHSPQAWKDELCGPFPKSTTNVCIEPTFH